MMETVALAMTGRRTTRLGFGCSGIAGGLERRRSLALLEAAYDAGVRHFDVAPMYGYGTAEDVLGQFLQRHADATVTTKFGIEPTPQSWAKRAVRSIAKSLLPDAVRVRRRESTKDSSVESDLRKSEFTRERAARSVESSLRLLRREHVDLLLMHECTADELVDPGLLEALHTWTDQRRIGVFGVGSTTAVLPRLIATRSAYCAVIQSEWSAFQPALVADARFHVTHRAMQCSWQQVRQQVIASPDLLLQLSQDTGCDLADVTVWPKLLLRAALVINAGTLVLFSTTNLSRIQTNCDAAFDRRLDRGAMRLHAYLSSFRCCSKPSHGGIVAGKPCCL